MGVGFGGSGRRAPEEGMEGGEQDGGRSLGLCGGGAGLVGWGSPSESTPLWALPLSSLTDKKRKKATDEQKRER